LNHKQNNTNNPVDYTNFPSKGTKRVPKKARFLTFESLVAPLYFGEVKLVGTKGRKI